MDFIADEDGGAGGTQAQAIDRFKVDLFVDGRVEGIDQSVDAAGLAGFGAAQFDGRADVRFAAEVMIKTDHAVDFSAGQVQVLRDLADVLLRDVSELRLHIVQNGQKRAFTACVPVENMI